jgi:hypothetical protein
MSDTQHQWKLDSRGEMHCRYCQLEMTMTNRLADCPLVPTKEEQSDEHPDEDATYIDDTSVVDTSID